MPLHVALDPDEKLVFFSHVKQKTPLFELVEKEVIHYGHGITNHYNEFKIDVYLLQDQPSTRFIALDWDNTFNINRKFFRRLVLKLVELGYEPFICSLRGPNKENLKEICTILEEAKIAIYLTDGKPKRAFMEGLGVNVHLWIDDFYPGICGDDCSLLTRNYIS